MAELIDLDKGCSQTQFAALVGISRQSLQGHIAGGTLRKRGTLREWLLALYAAQSSARGGHSADLATQRARLAKEQADKIERDNAVSRGELVPVSTAFAIQARCNALINDRAMSLPKRVMQRSKNPDDALRAEAEDLVAYIRQTLATIPDQVLAEIADAQPPTG